VVCGRGETAARCSPTSAFKRVLLPTFGLPSSSAKPERISARFRLPTVLLDGDVADHDGTVWPAAGRGHARDLRHKVKALFDLAENGVLPVEMRRGHLGDEPQASIRVRSRVRHREEA